jgi:hypothetical protein
MTSPEAEQPEATVWVETRKEKHMWSEEHSNRDEVGTRVV